MVRKYVAETVYNAFVKPIVKTFESFCAALIKASIDTAKKDPETVNKIARILLFIKKLKFNWY